MSNSLQSFVEKTVIFLSVIFSIAIGVLDFAGLLDTIPILAGKIPTVSLMLLSFVTTYIVFTTPAKEKARHEDLSNQISQIDDTLRQTIYTKVQVFKDFNSCVTYANNRLKKAKISVCSVYWDLSVNFSQAISQNLLHREIFIIDENSMQQYQAELQRRIGVNGRNHSCAYYRAAKDVSLQFVIIDSTEVIFLSSLSANNVSVQHPQIVNLLQHHFDEMWQKAAKLKLHDRINLERITMATMKSISRPIVFSEDLEKCIRRCLEIHEKSRSSQT